MLSAVVHTQYEFFITNPVGRIMSRFTNDQVNTDELLPLIAN